VSPAGALIVAVLDEADLEVIASGTEGDGSPAASDQRDP
jgi:hypothetical protein